jgi:membrane dipeptidase
MEESHWTKLHNQAVVVDCHTDVALDLFGEQDMFGERKNFRKLSDRGIKGHVDIPRLKEGGVDCQVFAIWPDPRRNNNPTLRALELIGQLTSEFDENKLTIQLAKSYPEIEAILMDNKIVALISLEGGEPLAGRPHLLRVFYDLGVRLIGLTWSYRNDLAFGNRENPKYGLTESGFGVVREASRLGVILDVSHLNEAGFYDLANSTSKPFIASHSNAKALREHTRNLTDHQIKIIADRGGVIGINFTPSFLADQQATLNIACKHIIYMRNLVGSEYVGLGSDFDGMAVTPAGLEDATKFPDISKNLVEAGLLDSEVENILGRSFMRVFKEILN